MALPPARDEAFFREVDEELRRAQLASVWQRHDRLIAAAIVVGLVLLAAGLYWQHRRTQAREAQAESFAGAIADLGENKEAAAKTALAGLAGQSGAYGAAAQLTEAGVAMAKGDLAGAATIYRAVAADTNAAQPFRDLATIRGTAADFDTLPPATVVERLRPLAVAGSPWFGSAAEMTALAWLKLGQPAKAGPLFAAIAKDRASPETLRARAVRISGVLGVDAVAAAGETN